MSEKFVLNLSFTNDCIATQTLPLNAPFFRVGILCYYSVSVALWTSEAGRWPFPRDGFVIPQKRAGVCRLRDLERGNDDGW